MGANVSASSSSSIDHPSRPSQRPSSFARYSAALLSGVDSPPMATERKKKYRFATLRRKLARVRRQSRCADHGRVARELIASWSASEIRALVSEYEASEVLRELSLHTAAARPRASTVSADLSRLYSRADCADVHLVYAGVRFPAHRALLSIRCEFFRHLLAHQPIGADVPVNLPGRQDVSAVVFSALLRYLYTGELDVDVDTTLTSKLTEVFGTPRPLASDLRTLLETGVHADAALLFDDDRDNALTCHKAILAARSPFFCSLLLRRANVACDGLTPIVLDTAVIPRRYARALLHAAYLDVVDLSCVGRDALGSASSSVSSLGEAQAIVAGRTPHTTGTDAAMELYQIGQFLDFPVLSQGCEDVIADSIVVDTLVPVLQWSCEPHGSEWVQRQAEQFLLDEFLQVAHSPVLHQLSKAYMVDAIRSDFLQAGELEVFSAVLRWGEHQLMKRIEDREPNLLSQTTHSVTRKGVRRRDLTDVELRAVLADLLPHVRADHILPRGADLLTGAVKRGLLCAPPSHMVTSAAGYTPASAWVRNAGSGGGMSSVAGSIYVKPRLFWPYYEEAKLMLSEQQADCDHQALSHYVEPHHLSHRHHAIPDTLYMVDEGEYRGGGLQHQRPAAAAPFTTVDIIAGTIAVPDAATLTEMRLRESSLRATALVKRALVMLRCDQAAVEHQLRLRVVREFALPDATAAVLQRHLVETDVTRVTGRQGQHRHRRYVSASSMAAGHDKCDDFGIAGSSGSGSAKHSNGSPVMVRCSMLEKDLPPSGTSTLSDLMPDIAMATSTVNQMALHDCDVTAPLDLELDLGDGNNHSTSGTLYL